MNKPRQVAEAELGRLLLPLARRWRGQADRAVADLGLSHASGWVLLHIGRLDADGGGVRQGELAEAADMRGSSLVPQIDRLEGTGLVLRQAEDGDRRANRVRLTDAGKALVGQIEDALVQIRATLLGDIADDDLDAMLRALRLLDRRLLARRDGAR